jgi:hypothetical protein
MGSESEDLLDARYSTSVIDPSLMDLPSPRSLAFLFPHFDLDIPPALDTTGQASNTLDVSPEGVDESAQIDATDYTSEIWSFNTFWENRSRTTPMPRNLDLTTHVSQTISLTPQDHEDEVERIAHLFHEHTCLKISIEEEADRNPWENLIWPLAREHRVVYHALAALTCFGASEPQSQLRAEGKRHLQRSTQLLSDNVAEGQIPLDAVLAATLALVFAETWSDKTTSAGATHIRAGGALLQQILSNRCSGELGGEEEACLTFLAHVWIYVDVLARFTCSDLSQPYSASASGPDLSQLPQNPPRLNPLMGYSTTFFPIMRRVADLINKVRARETPRNSPAIISQALELRRAIEQWTLPIDLETIDDPSQTMTDAIQTAEAYRWSSLLMLYQAVPELPNLTSYGELAQKILVYLATIPLTSSTIIVHAFPLMVAGCDAVEEEDRQFVRERWAAMSARKAPSLISQCLKVTEEIWKRREEYLWKRGLSFTSGGVRINTEAGALSKDIASFIDLGNGNGGEGRTGVRMGMGKSNDFPISAAFRKGVDGLTRSGCTEYTVRGRLHWLGVMRDWGWEGK